MFKKRLLNAAGMITGLFFGLAGAAHACTPLHHFTTITPGTLTIAAVSYPPFSSINTDGTITGTDAEIASKIAAMECLKVAVVPADYASAIQFLVAGRADITIGEWYRTAARAKVVNLSDPLYLDQMGFASKAGYDSISQIKGGITLGTVQGYLWDADLAAILGNSLKTYPDTAHVEEDYAAGRIDVVADGQLSLLMEQKAGGLQGAKITVVKPDSRVKASLYPSQVTFPMNNKDSGMLAAFNADIATLKGDGTVSAILTKYGLPGASITNTGTPRLQ